MKSEISCNREGFKIVNCSKNPHIRNWFHSNGLAIFLMKTANFQNLAKKVSYKCAY